jgi:hypothetical protein
MHKTGKRPILPKGVIWRVAVTFLPVTVAMNRLRLSEILYGGFQSGPARHFEAQTFGGANTSKQQLRTPVCLRRRPFSRVRGPLASACFVLARGTWRRA